jgi:ribosome-binding factor A
MIRSKVKDWDTWKKSFDSHIQKRIDAGLTDRVISHTVGDTHQVTLVFAVADMAKATAFMNSQDLKDKMKEAGVEGPPDVFYYKVTQRY